ncbi:MAG: isocitrate lyase/PEP mutase family protein [Limisphaerales bacterium]
MHSDEQRAHAATLRELHRGPKILVLPNAWDCLSARLFEQAGFAAIATTSGGIAATLGYPDGQRISAREMLQMVGRIAATVSVPVSADLEAGYGKTPREVAETIRQAIGLGAAGANLEDGRGPDQPLAEIARQTDIIKAVREAAAACGIPLVLNARVDVYLHGVGSDTARFSQAVERAIAYRDAGADCVFPIGLKDRETIARFVREVACPVNIMAGPGAPAITELESIGVRRATFGSGMTRAILPLVQRMAKELRLSGKSGLLEQAEFSHATVNELFKVT